MRNFKTSLADRKSTRLNSSHDQISYAVFCLKKKEHTSELQSRSDIVCRLLLVKIERGGSVPLSYTVRSPVKGDFRIGPVRVRSLDPLALGAEDAVLSVDARVVVAPTMEDLRRTKLQPRRTRPWFGQVASRQIGAGTDFWGVREYTAGDEVRRINWKASARLDRLFTNEYEGERSGDVVIVVDARREVFVGPEAGNRKRRGGVAS